MALGRKPTNKELGEITADIVRLYQSDPKKYEHLLGNRDAVEGNENNTDIQEAIYQLKYATIVIVDNVEPKSSLVVTEKTGVIFWGSDNFFTVLTLNNAGNLSIFLKECIEYVG